jgi:hypothetical protein
VSSKDFLRDVEGNRLDLVEGSTPSETEKEAADTEYETGNVGSLITELTENLTGNCSGRAGLKEGADVAVGE